MATLDSVQEHSAPDALAPASPTYSIKVEHREIETDFGKVKVHIQGKT